MTLGVPKSFKGEPKLMVRGVNPYSPHHWFTPLPGLRERSQESDAEVIEQGVRAEEKQGSLLVYDKDGAVVARFSVSQVEHWWAGSTKRPETF